MWTSGLIRSYEAVSGNDHQRETAPRPISLRPERYMAAAHHLPSDSHVDQRQLVLHNHFLARCQFTRVAVAKVPVIIVITLW